MTEGATLPEGEEGMGEAGTVMNSDWLRLTEEDTRVRLVGLVAVSEGAEILQDMSEV